jgi:hypothetical protein
MHGVCTNEKADKSSNRTVFDYSCRHHTGKEDNGEIILSDATVQNWLNELPGFQRMIDRLPITSNAVLSLTVMLAVFQAALEEVQQHRAQHARAADEPYKCARCGSRNPNEHFDYCPSA